MTKYNIIEKFCSIDGEGPTAGEISTFIRFGRCNLKCTWCDTDYSTGENVYGEQMTAEEIYDFIAQNGTENVTITGGEPLIQKDIDKVLVFLSQKQQLKIQIETNGSVSIDRFKDKLIRENCGQNVRFILDYKLPLSKMEQHMDKSNLKAVGKEDVYKFVIGSDEDLKTAYNIINEYSLTEKCLVYFSPVIGKIEPTEIVDFMKKHKLNKIKLQLQLHKIIWSPDMRGV
ncbi:putative 7-carboxy-7-deazaguanine synthase QueE [Proteinivorax hydrogeniformans]|uniref:7-carboxy-7-deazaguanine synthase n=1 Tax=Proteinivorax hydrogeniformans TaxID=1826727 RepID=A0AAU8HRP8_9FIRM